MSLIINGSKDEIEATPGWSSMIMEIIEINKMAIEINKMAMKALSATPQFIVRSDDVLTKEEIRNQFKT